MKILQTQQGDTNKKRIIDTSANNKGKINKKQLMKMTKQERASLIFQDMQETLDNLPQDIIQQEKIVQNAHDSRMYLNTPSSKHYHIEMVKRIFTKQAPYQDPDELNLQFAQYFKLCFEHKKIPTIERFMPLFRYHYSPASNTMPIIPNLYSSMLLLMLNLIFMNLYNKPLLRAILIQKYTALWQKIIGTLPKIRAKTCL